MILELIENILDFCTSWRLYLSIFACVIIACGLHALFQDASWIYFISIPLVIGGVVGGFIWQMKSDAKSVYKTNSQD